MSADEAAAAALATGPDGRPRCWWSLGTPEYVRYHDEEWGRPVLDDRLFFEHLCLEAFQSGLSWLTILRKRDAFRAAFADFDPVVVAAFGCDDAQRLLVDAGIVRNKRKIDAVIANAGVALALIAEHGSLAAFFWAYVDGGSGGAAGRTPAGGAAASGGAPAGAAADGATDAAAGLEAPAAIRRRDDIPAVTQASAALAKELKRRGFRFLGPTTVYAHMQACGMVNDHVDGCCVRDEVQRLQNEARQALPERSQTP